MARTSSHEQGLELQGWAMYTPQGHPVPVRQACGTRWQDQAHTNEKLHHRDTMKLRLEQGHSGLATCGALPGSIRTSGHVTSGNKIFSSGNATSRSSRQWWGEVLKRRCCQVPGAGAILNNWAHSSLVIYPRSWKSDIATTCWCRERLSDASIGCYS